MAPLGFSLTLVSLGKTSITLAAIKLLKREGILNRVLIVAPLRVCYSVWPSEVKKWADFEHLRVEVLHGSGKEKALKRDADIYLINPEGLDWLFREGRFKILNPDTLVIDESSRFKNTQTRRFKDLKPNLGKFKRRWILTGTPVPNGMLDLFGQIYILDQGNALSPFITHYKNKFFDPYGFGGYSWSLKPGAEEQIYELVRPLTLRLEAGDYLELPELVNSTIRIDLPESARKIYDDLEDLLIATITGDEVVTAMSAAAASMKCRQVANGGLYRQLEDVPALDSDKWVTIHDQKTEAVLELLEEIGGSPVIVTYEFHHDRERLLKALGKNTPFIGGGVAPKRSREIEAEWNAGNLPVLLGQPQSIAHGLNLQESGYHFIWHSMTWNYEDYDQSIKRILRQGQRSKTVFNHHIIARDTVDEVLLRAMGFKKKNQNNFLDALKEYAKTKSRRR